MKIAVTSASGQLGSAIVRQLLQILQADKHHGQTYHLLGQPITQAQLAAFMNEAFGTQLNYQPMTVVDYLAERKHALGQFLGTIIGGIYEGIRQGNFAPPSDFERAAGRPHKSPQEMIAAFRHGLKA